MSEASDLVASGARPEVPLFCLREHGDAALPVRDDHNQRQGNRQWHMHKSGTTRSEEYMYEDEAQAGRQAAAPRPRAPQRSPEQGVFLVAELGARFSHSHARREEEEDDDEAGVVTKKKQTKRCTGRPESDKDRRSARNSEQEKKDVRSASSGDLMGRWRPCPALPCLPHLHSKNKKDIFRLPPN